MTGRPLRKMRGLDFVERMLSGERMFSGIELEERFDLTACDRFPELQSYLKLQPFNGNPIVLSQSRLIGLKAIGLNLPYLEADDTVLKDANLRDCQLMWSNFWNANLSNVNFGHANLDHANLEESILESAYLGGANLADAKLGNARLRFASFEHTDVLRADFKHVNFREADLRKSIHLNTAENLGLASYDRTVVSTYEKTIIEKELARRNLFVVLDG